MLDKTPQFCFITWKKHWDKTPADSQEMTAFYIYAKKIKTNVFVMAKYGFLDSLFQSKGMWWNTCSRKL